MADLHTEPDRSALVAATRTWHKEVETSGFPGGRALHRGPLRHQSLTLPRYWAALAGALTRSTRSTTIRLHAVDRASCGIG